MAEKELETVQDEDILEASESVEEVSEDTEQLDEFKADKEDSEVADPVATKDNKRPADKSVGADPMPKLSKSQMISAMLSKMSGMNKTSLQAEYDKLLDNSGKEAPSRKADKNGGEKMSKNSTATPGQGSIKEDVQDIFDGTDLPKELQEKAEVVFEAAVGSKIIAIEEELKEVYEDKLNEAIEQKSKELQERSEEYLDYVAEAWMKENEVEVVNSLKVEMAESLFAGFKNLIEQHSIVLPEGDGVDALEGLSAEVKDLEEKLDNEVNEKIALAKELEEAQVANIFSEAVDGLTEAQKDKLRSLSEGLDYENAEDYEKKVNTLKESYFSKPQTDDTIEDAGPVDLEEETQISTNPEMDKYSAAIKRTIRK